MVPYPEAGDSAIDTYRIVICRHCPDCVVEFDPQPGNKEKYGSFHFRWSGGPCSTITDFNKTSCDKTGSFKKNKKESVRAQH